MTTLESLPECLLLHIFYNLDASDFKSVSLVSTSWCSLSDTCVREISLDPKLRGIPTTQQELRRFTGRFSQVKKIKIRADVAAGVSPALHLPYLQTKNDTLHVILFLLEVYKADLEILEICMLNGDLFKPLQKGFPNLRRLKLFSSPSSSYSSAYDTDNHFHNVNDQDSLLKIFEDSAHMEYLECNLPYYLEPRSLKRLAKLASFQQLRILVFGQKLLEEEIFSVIDCCTELEYLRLGNVVPSTLDIRFSGLTSPFTRLHTLDITFLDGFFTDNSIHSISSLVPSLQKFRLNFKPTDSNCEYGNGVVSDVGFKILAINCRFLEVFELNLPTDTIGEGFHLGFRHLCRLHLAHQGYLWTKENGWQLSRKSFGK